MRGAGGVEEFHVAGARQFAQFRRIAGGEGGLHVVARHRDRHRRIGLAVDEQLRHAERQQLARRCFLVAPRLFGGRAAEQLTGRVAAKAQFLRAHQVRHRRLADDGAEADAGKIGWLARFFVSAMFPF